MTSIWREAPRNQHPIFPLLKRLDEIRKHARDLNNTIASAPESFAHLRGRSVSIAEHATDDARPKNRSQPAKRAELVDELAAALQRDFGVAFEWPSAEHIPAEVARRGRECVEEYEVTVVRQLQQPDALPIVTADIQITRSGRTIYAIVCQAD